jgi:PEP-CTERM motif
VKLVKMLSVAALILCSASLTLADGVDPIINPNRGPTGSAPLTPSFAISGANSDPNCTAQCYTVESGLVTSITFAAPISDDITCGISNAFLDSPGQIFLLQGANPLNVNNYYTKPTVSGSNDVCSWTTFTGTEPDEGFESVAKMESDCLLTNFGVIRDADDCAGVPSGTTNSDLVLPVTGPNGPVTLETPIIASATGVPEPASLSMLLIGLAGLFMYRRRRIA